MPEAALIYLRYSPRPEKKADACPSLEIQETRIRAYLKFIGMAAGERFADPLVSARKTSLIDRPGGKRLLETLGYRIKPCPHGPWPPIIYSPGKLKYRTVVVYDLSRMFRNWIDAAFWLDRWATDGIALHTAGGIIFDATTADGALIASMLTAVAVYAPKKTSERTSDSKKTRLANGKAIGPHVPYGWERDPDSEPHPDSGLPQGLKSNAHEQAAIRLAKSLRDEGTSYREIGEQLVREGYRPRGAKWHAQAVKSLLKARLSG